MKFDQGSITENIAKAKVLLRNPEHCSPEFSTVISLILNLFELLLPRLFKNSRNSSIPPSQDPNRNKDTEDQEDQEGKSKKKPGGQPGRKGKNLVPFDKPDEVIEIKINRETLPESHTYTYVGVAKRQVVDIIVSRHVKEYRLEILQDENGKIYTAEPPKGIGRPVQYGSSVKAMAVYLNTFQLLPYARLEDYFATQADIPVSAGSLCNFNQEAFHLLEGFEEKARNSLALADILHTDETGININGKKFWMHNASNDLWTLLMPHETRGTKAMEAMDILPHFKGVMIHDHWTPYFTYEGCQHSLCNAHHLRELQAVIEAVPKNTWAASMKELLLEINNATNKNNGVLDKAEIEKYQIQYRAILQKGDEECPPPTRPDTEKKRGRLKKSKERNLLERLRNFETETLRFMTRVDVPFTNNQGERDIRMLKVQQKISGCYKSIDTAKIACRIRSYLLTCQKHGLAATDALTALFTGKMPDFCA